MLKIELNSFVVGLVMGFLFLLGIFASCNDKFLAKIHEWLMYFHKRNTKAFSSGLFIGLYCLLFLVAKTSNWLFGMIPGGVSNKDLGIITYSFLLLFAAFFVWLLNLAIKSNQPSKNSEHVN